MRKKDEKILVTKSFLPPLSEYEAYLEQIWKSSWLTNMGVYHEQLRESLKKYLNVGGLELFTNGHLALEMAIQAMKLSGEIITTPFTFASTTHAIVRNGLKPVFCDIDPKNCTIDADKIESLITEKTSAIVPVHVYGHICAMEKIEQIAKKHGLHVIYDAAHAFGEKYKGVGIGNFGDASMFSFHATKVFHTIEGGAVTYNNEELEKILYQLKNFGILDKETVSYVGGNAKMSEFQAAMGLCNLKYLDSIISKRKQLAKRYETLLSGIEGIRILEYNKDVEYNYAYMPVVFSGSFERDRIYEALAKKQIYARKYFYPCVNAYDCYKESYDEDATPIAKAISKQILTLPLYPDLDSDVVEEICEIIIKTRSE